MQDNNKPSISAEEILTAEFEYIAHTASQANDDRSSVVSFFIIAVGSPLAAFFSTDLAQIPEQTAYALFTGLFLILAILGTTTILQLARLRGAWYESMLAMNHMKEFLIKNSDADISGAFRWSFSTAPARFKPNSVSFYQALEVAILAGLLFGAFVFFLLHSLRMQNEFTIWLTSALLGILFAGSQIFVYRRFLK
jgi:multidrug transporter EmrE-like cation transporter